MHKQAESLGLRLQLPSCQVVAVTPSPCPPMNWAPRAGSFPADMPMCISKEEGRPLKLRNSNIISTVTNLQSFLCVTQHRVQSSMCSMIPFRFACLIMLLLECVV